MMVFEDYMAIVNSAKDEQSDKKVGLQGQYGNKRENTITTSTILDGRGRPIFSWFPNE